MSCIKQYVLVLLFTVPCTGCVTQTPLNLGTDRSGNRQPLHAPIQSIQSRTIFLDPHRSSNTLQPLSEADLRPVLKVRPEAVAFLSQPAMMLTKNSDGSIGIRARAPLAFQPVRSEVLQSVLFGEKNSFLSQGLMPYLFASCELPN